VCNSQSGTEEPYVVDSDAQSHDTIRYDTTEEFNMDSKAEYSALSSTRSQKKKL